MGVCKINGKSQQAVQNAQHKSTEKKTHKWTGSMDMNTERSGDLNKLPQVTFPDVFSYLVCGAKKQGRRL